MKIGIEAKWLFRGPPSGQRVVLNLVESLVDSAGDDEIHFFLDARSRDRVPAVEIPRDRRHYVWAGNNQLSNVFLVPRIADRLGLDVVVYQNFAPPAYAVRHKRVAFVHDVIFDSHPQFFTWRERLYFKPLRRLTSTADRVCTVSQSEIARLVRFNYAAAERIDVVPNAVDATFAPRECLRPLLVSDVRRALDLPDVFVLYVGRLTARKNVETLIRAMAYVASPVTLVVVGVRDRTSLDLDAVAKSCGVDRRVRFLGPLAVGDDRLRVLYADATVFCFPSLEESFGLPPLEAMASGTPVIVSNVAAVVETCGDAAVFIDPTDARAIAEAIDALMNDSARRAELRAAGLARAESFSWARSAQRLLATAHAAAAS
ncbi:MAG TPA: glycosyltransferase family 1 protein [Gemmatimonadaceae bacterium]|jgi:glycosyltransferase involved in cell wall biosynthesis|nr:glycosyltransferase family 1 protein [Gemmatimonadaceae bacterium]